ncbi:MAG: hypothetical protein AB7F40_07475 [Victivallaceae bacterium]|nr:hypothetical protein [Victivallaceae bacterium]
MDVVAIALRAVCYPLLALAVSLGLTALCIKVLPRLGFIDMPDPRRVHHIPTPRGGGFAIIAGFFISCGAMAVFGGTGVVHGFLRDMWLPGLIIIVVGALDDRFTLRARTKLICQIAVAFLVWLQPFREQPQRLMFFFAELPDWASCAITMFLVVAIINAFNLIDGLDGLAAGLSAVSAGCLAVWALMISRRPELMIVYLILAGSCLGFLRYNFAPARIFMGDVGSNFLGLFFAAGVLNSMSRAATTVAVLVPLMAVGVPVFDVFLAFWRRLLRRLSVKFGSQKEHEGIMSADMDHLHHRIYAQNQNQRKTALLLYFVACCFALAGVGVMFFSHGNSVIGYFLVVLVAVVAVRRFATVEMVDSARMLVGGLKRPHHGFIFSLVHPFFDLFCIAVAHVLANMLLRMAPFAITVKSLPFIGILFLTLLLGGAYRIYWLRASIRDYRFLAELLFFGALLALLANRLFGGPWTMERAVVFFMFSGVFIFGERLVLRYIESFMLRQIFIKKSQTMDIAVIFGAGLGCRTYLSAVGYIYDDLFRIGGIIDDDRSLQGMEIYGHTVLGGRADLEELYERKPFQRLIITAYHISDEVIEELRVFAVKHNVRLYRFRAEAVELPTDRA